MEIKTTLKQLKMLFARSAGDDGLAESVRRLAARLTVLTAHVERVEAKVDAETAARRALDQQVAELVTMVTPLIAARGITTAPPTATTLPPAANGAVEVVDEDAEAAAMAAQVRKDTEDELLAAQNGATVTALRPNGEAPAESAT